MGICHTSYVSEEDKANARNAKVTTRAIDDQNYDDFIKSNSIKKLLLLGAGESGKSTLFKQMNYLYGKGYGQDDRKSYTNIVYNNTIQCMQVLIKSSEQFTKKKNQEKDCKIADSNKDSSDFILELKADDKIDETVAEHINNLWSDQGIRNTFACRSKIQLADSAEYFFSRVNEYAKSSFIPDYKDLLRTRVRTTGIVETTFTIESNRFRVFDVGGQRNERKKWIHCFENVTAVIFVAAISEYDQVLYEDETTNRMDEALNLFDEICNSRWFRETSMILFLNKNDLFIEKLKKVEMSDYFLDYTGPNEYERCVDFIKSRFEERKRAEEKEIYTHVTCATDTKNVDHVFNAVKDIIIRRSLREGGLI